MAGTLPQISGLVFDAIYEAGKAEAKVGGDWYDAFRLSDGRIVLSVGDVAGSGLEAAVMMTNVRQSIRTAAIINPDPAAILESADRIVRSLDHDKFVTAFVGVLDPIHLELCYASAGHPPALLQNAHGRVALLEHGSLPLGIRERFADPSSVAALEPGSMLVLYTDGLTEVGRDPILGEASVLDAIGTVVNRKQAAREIFSAIMRGESPHDDIAILTVAIEALPGTNSVARWSFAANDSLAAKLTRQQFHAQLLAQGLSELEIADAELVLSELIGNVVRYAVGTVTVALDTTTESPVLHVLDEGAGFEHSSRLPNDVMQENGRGLFIVSRVAEEFTVSRRPGGGSHARAVIAGRIRRSRGSRTVI